MNDARNKNSKASGSRRTSTLTAEWRNMKAQLYAKRIKTNDPKIGTSENEDQINHEIGVLEHCLMTMPAFADWVLFEKFQLFREIPGHDFQVFTDRREWIFLAALEADAIRLAGEAA